MKSHGTIDTSKPDRSSRRGFLRSVAAVAAGGLWAFSSSRIRADSRGDPKRPWPFYAFDNGLGTIPKLEDKVRVLKDLGYVGLEYHLNHDELPRMLEALDKYDLELNAVYTVPWLEDPVDPRLAESIRRLRERSTRIEMAIRSREIKAPSSDKGDDRACELLKEVSDFCGDTGPVVSVYPHAGFWTEKVDDGVRLAKKLRRKNVGANFNLVHWHWVEQKRSLDAVLREALPHLLSVTINNGKKAGREISSLDEGDYDLSEFLKLLWQIGYRGPVGLQCYSVQGPSEEHLKRSWNVWRKLLRDVGVPGSA